MRRVKITTTYKSKKDIAEEYVLSQSNICEHLLKFQFSENSSDRLRCDLRLMLPLYNITETDDDIINSTKDNCKTSV